MLKEREGRRREKGKIKGSKRREGEEGRDGREGVREKRKMKVDGFIVSYKLSLFLAIFRALFFVLDYDDYFYF